MKTTKKLSLEDFKVTKINNQCEIDKLIGGAAAECHPEVKQPTPTKYPLYVNGNITIWGGDKEASL